MARMAQKWPFGKCRYNSVKGRSKKLSMRQYNRTSKCLTNFAKSDCKAFAKREF